KTQEKSCPDHITGKSALPDNRRFLPLANLALPANTPAEDALSQWTWPHLFAFLSGFFDQASHPMVEKGAVSLLRLGVSSDAFVCLLPHMPVHHNPGPWHWRSSRSAAGN